MDFLWPLLGGILGGVIAAIITHQLDLRRFRKERDYDFRERELINKRDSLAKLLGTPMASIHATIQNVEFGVVKASSSDRLWQAHLDNLQQLQQTAIETRMIFHDKEHVRNAFIGLERLILTLAYPGFDDPSSPIEKPTVEEYEVLRDILEAELHRLHQEINSLYK